MIPPTTTSGCRPPTAGATRNRPGSGPAAELPRTLRARMPRLLSLCLAGLLLAGCQKQDTGSAGASGAPNDNTHAGARELTTKLGTMVLVPATEFVMGD